MEAFNEILRQHFYDSDMTLSSASSIIGVDPKTFRRWMEGEKRPTPENFHTLLDVFNLDASDRINMSKSYVKSCGMDEVFNELLKQSISIMSI